MGEEEIEAIEAMKKCPTCGDELHFEHFSCDGCELTLHLMCCCGCKSKFIITYSLA